ncbi:MAG: family 78 glycoside hydrolase catalytic domain [Prolixibacteraceae bacterium]|jgi:alpha-L-rhamnosidase|nr:family 78 glycoside hydrolase catalytic domain [Prolixibacteraceae bacterium]
MLTNLKTEYKTNPLGLGSTKPRLSWELQTDKYNIIQTAYQIQCAQTSDKLLAEENLLWNSGKIESDQSTHVEYNGKPLTSETTVFWRVRVWDNQGEEYNWSQSAFWSMGLLAPNDWKADWIESSIDENVSESTPCPFFRHQFSINSPVKDAKIYVTARGLYELSINGQKAGNEIFTPGWTSYQGRLQYQVFDVKNHIKQGENAIGAILGDGWYRGYLAWQGNKNTYGEKTALLAQLKITFDNGEIQTIVTNENWKSTTGPILKSDIYNGEKHDANLEMEGWNRTGFDNSKWKPVTIANYPKNNLVASEGSPVRVTETIKPVKLITTPKGEQVVDFGQNMVGVVRFKLKGNKGQNINLNHAEVLDKDGNFYRENIREADAEDVYTFKGDGIEEWSPRFTFHGFRYLRINDYQGSLSLNNFEGLVIHSDMEAIGSFECSDSLINQLQQNIQWGLRGNFLDVPTDCPQRDERLGWTGDAQVFASTAVFNMNTAPFYTKWMKDFPIDQKEDGSVPWVVPNIVEDGAGTGWSDGYGATGWSDAAIIIPWEVYQAYGDRRILENQYESMKAWEEYMIKHSGNSYIFNYGFHFGDWLAFAEYMSYHYNAPDYGYAGAYTAKDLIATAYFYYSTGLMQEIATILGKTDDAERYMSIRPKIKQAFQKEFITETGRITSNSQTAYTLALMFGLYNDNMTANAANRLAKDVKHFEHLTTGFLGTPLICQALSENGYPELAYKLLFNKRYPSWLYPITKGATTIWERWDCIKPDGSFQDAGMNSFNHYAYGAVGNWMYNNVAGLQKDAEQQGYKHFIVKPLIPEELSYAKAKLHTMYGEASVCWKKTENGLSLDVSIPPNTKATINIPYTNGEISLNGAELKTYENIEFIGENNGFYSVKAGSGKYQFKLEGSYQTIKQ